MSTTYAPPVRSTRRVATTDISARAAGIGALGFAASVIVQNILRAGAPQPGADLGEVVTHFAEHRGLTVTLTATFILGLCGLAVFLGGTVRRLAASDRRGWAILGSVGAC